MALRISYENLIMDIYLFNRVKNRGNMFVAKLLYLYEEKLFDEKMIGAHYIMYRDNYGPYNREIYSDLETLARRGFLKLEKIYSHEYDNFFSVYSSTNMTFQIIEDIKELIDENEKIFRYFDDIIKCFESYNAKNLKEYVYSLKKTGIKGKKIIDYNIDELILDPFKIENPIMKFELDKDWYDTVEVLLNPELGAEFQEAIDDVRTGNVIFY